LHPYETITLAAGGLVTGALLSVICLVGLLTGKDSIRVVRSLPRNYPAGQFFLGIAMLWFWLLIAPDSLGKLSALSFDLGAFAKVKQFLQLAVPACYILMVIYVKEFLFVRGFGLLMLLLAMPILSAAFLKEPSSRLLLPILAYLMIVAGLFCVGQPYRLRDWIAFITHTPNRWRILTSIGFVYGVIIISCSLLIW
jgi:hypothetical protein